MDALDIKSYDKTLVVTFDKAFFKESYLNDLLTRIRTEYLIQKADFDESVEDIGEEIKHNWWQKNKSKYIKE